MRYSEMTKDYAPISQKQYGLARDIGYTQDELRNANYYWFKQRAEEILAPYKNEFALATQRQLDWIANNAGEEVDFDVEEILYGSARFVIRNIARAQNNDPLYLAYIEYEEEKQRKKQHHDTTARIARKNRSGPVGTKAQPATTTGPVGTASNTYTNGKARIVPAKVELPKIAQAEIKLLAGNSAWNADPFFDQFTEDELA